MTYRADLHIHSYASDGQWSPEEIVEQIKKHHIRTFAVSDHDEVGCIPHMSRLTEGQDLDYIKAVEISVLYKGKEHHVLTYYIDETDPVLLEIIDSNRALREDYNVGLIDFLNPQYPQVTHEDYGQYSYMPYQGGWKFFAYLKDHGIIHNIQDFFALVKGFDYGKRKQFRSPEEVIPKLIERGYVPILAHPPAYASDDLYPEADLDYWRQVGIMGLECYTQYMKDLNNAQYYVDYCIKYDLMITGGSDCHGGFAGRRLGHPHVTESMITLKRLKPHTGG